MGNQSETSYTLAALSITAMTLLLLAFIYHWGVWNTIPSIRQRKPTRLLVYLVCSCFFGLAFALLSQAPYFMGIDSLNHPIDGLMNTGKQSHDSWLLQASESKTLAEAVKVYKRRYHRHPPPGFDIWYEFALNRQSAVIDDFDSINDDLAPFWALDPKELRLRTEEVTQIRYNNVIKLQIRSGVARVPDMIRSHKWMLEGIIRMMTPFIKHIPDMDLAFNIDDEPRVAVPYDSLMSHLSVLAEGIEGLKTDDGIVGPKRAVQAQDFNDGSSAIASQARKGDFEDWPWQPNFQRYGAVACPPDSPARKYRSWSSPTLCNWCFQPHSIGHFISNWTFSASPCHQPDLTNLHGFYTSPSTYKTTKHLMPIFSQSKAHGFADILYPTAWNYLDKVKYDPSHQEHREDSPFSQKQNTLFWRGSTTEGFSWLGQWRGMVRQRFVFLNTNSTYSLPVYLPLPKRTDGYAYQKITRAQFLSHPSIIGSGFTFDTRIISIDRRWGNDFTAQLRQFGDGSALKIDFQEHWQYKYLMDMDGAGFSGRFLPFLESHSLPFKTALFREWYDSRITAWTHFVPVDIRLHGLWSTLAYFTGDFSGDGKDRGVFGRDRGEWIAEQGREWAHKALRKEDMEIYLFRLLIEWARLTNDRRDELRFQLNEDDVKS